ncbi:LysR family transcriptional regulator [Sphingosinicella sp.]|jgi:DNA-binding transcriptional LysR family regulator|uniref:LysR family transcriptional regulator n=1 Tax=Sphingosinicella sp. TaxID=1917971 RepID=UPI0018325E28|nr:LysR family transcriptional regulator [Sphingosinicella sp.]MBA4760117.1 LysR family transcriptional regulator [Sphingosinicella sp.]MEA3539676.1 LysR family transcriptional regulator [Pseudomonadota bacterium]
MFDWNDLRHFLAVARTGSTLAAGQALRVSQTTVARRITALEAALGVTLFERRQSGYALTPAGEALLLHAEAVDTATANFADAANHHIRQASGMVRLTAQEILTVTVLAPVLRDLRRAYPSITIELDTTDTVRDLSAGEADVALRSARRIHGGGLVCRRLGDEPWTAYCSRSYAASNGVPRTVETLREHPLIVGGGGRIWEIYKTFLEQNDLGSAVAIHHASVTGILAAVKSGSGVAILPGFVADADPDLICCIPVPGGVERGVWLVTHERVRHVPHVRAVMDFLGDALSRLTRRPVGG